MYRAVKAHRTASCAMPCGMLSHDLNVMCMYCKDMMFNQLRPSIVCKCIQCMARQQPTRMVWDARTDLL